MMTYTKKCNNLSISPLCPSTSPLGWLLLGLVVFLSACGGNKNTFVPPPPPPVTVSQPIEQEVIKYAEFTGNTAPLESVELRARVRGFLKSINFTPGSEVKKGDLLFVIEPEPYQVKVDQAKADLQRNENQYKAAEDELAIVQAMAAKSAASKIDLVQKTERRDTAKANVAAARATLEQAQIDLSYTSIYAPISGQISRNYVDAGNLVGQGDPTLLATIVKYDPLYAYFTASESALLDYSKILRQHKANGEHGGSIEVQLGLAHEPGYPHKGWFESSDNRVDRDTGTILLRAVFPNPDRSLFPGVFARIRIPADSMRALLVPDEALATDQAGKYMLAVNDKNVVEVRRVKTGASQDGLTIIQDGLAAGEWIVVNGLQRARPGSTVNPERQKLEETRTARALNSTATARP
jgi:RND family efflux transporter MFP subunit